GLLVGRVAWEVPGGRELAELHADHVFADQHRHVLLAVVHAERQAHELGHDGRAARPGLDHVLAAGRLQGICLLQQISVDERAFPNRAGHRLAGLLHVTATDDVLVRGLVGAGLVALGGLAPRGHRVTTAGGLALAAAVRVIDRIHGDAAHVRPAAHVADAPGLAEHLVHVIRVRHRADRGHAAVEHHAQLAGAEADLGVAGVAADQLGVGPGRTGDLAALAGLQLDVVHHRTDRQAAQ